MSDAPIAIALIGLFAAIFAFCIVWATRGHTADADNEDLSVVAKDH